MTVSGVLVIDKPKGMTSHDVVARVRRKLGLRKVGHAGTLDPDVTGVLVVCVGDATRLLEYIQATTKTYEGEVTFGISTDTDDASGSVLQRVPCPTLTEAQVRAAATHFKGEILQRVPAFSAVHIDGKRAYDLARAGQKFDLPERLVRIDDMLVLEFQSGEFPRARFRILCSKGTYVRSICRDWGSLWLNTPSHMSDLRRVQSGAFCESESVTLDEFTSSESPEQYLLSVDVAVRELPRTQLAPREVQKFVNGLSIRTSESSDEIVAVYCQSGTFIGIGQVLSSSNGLVLKPKKVLARKGE